jgi:DNA-binding GntR family transcriptional regulator
MLTPIDRSSLADEVAAKLRTEILTGNIRPGERMLEQEISAMMKTSRGPVRDALVQLEQEGLVVREPNRSATVVSMTSEDVEEVHSLRLSLELLALRYVIERAGEKDLEQLEEAIEPLRACLRDDFSLQKAVDLDLLFHEVFVKTSRHSRVLSMWQNIKPQIWFLIYTRNAYDIKSFAMAVDTHVEILELIRERDHDQAKIIVKNHLDDAYASLIATFKSTRPIEQDIP